MCKGEFLEALNKGNFLEKLRILKASEISILEEGVKMKYHAQLRKVDVLHRF